ncbi:RHS repeat-associated core domain-containing protein [Vreelandella sp. GE22]
MRHENGTTATTHYGWDGDRIVREESESQHSTIVYEPGSFVPMLRIDDTEQGPQLSAFVTDAIGTPMQLVAANGETQWQGQPDDWAAVKNIRGNTAQPIRFQGQWQDEESGLYYNRHRYYDPQQGRYVSQDPIGLNGGTNLYGYVINPTGIIDPLGFSSIASNCNDLINTITDKANNSWDGLKWRYDAVSSGLQEDFSDGALEGLIRFTGGRTEENFINQTMETYYSSSIAIRFIGDPLETGAGMWAGGKMAQSYGGYTVGNYILQGPAPHLGTHLGTLRLVAATSVANSAMVTGAYEAGTMSGAGIRTTANRFFRKFDNFLNWVKK